MKEQTGEEAGMRGRLRQAPVLLVVGLALLVLAAGLFRLGPFSYRSLPDFAGIDDIEERKAAFFSYLHPFILEANGTIMAERERLEIILDHFDHGPLSRRDDRWIRQMATKYGQELSEEEPVGKAAIGELLRQVDIIPPSMALAQAALESGWGTSRYARKGNNLYGIWCYEPGCGLVPRHRPAGETYEVARFRTPRQCFESYISNLNTNSAYAPLWDIRESLRAAGEPVNGMAVSDGLVRYSTEGWTYISKVQDVIRSNQLQSYDDVPF